MQSTCANLKVGDKVKVYLGLGSKKPIKTAIYTVKKKIQRAEYDSNVIELTLENIEKKADGSTRTHTVKKPCREDTKVEVVEND